ncbi:hypothetical protein LEP1GSC076_0632 [Leptospira sp. Fiocruz LV4135]|nr:hypothetical protein LEP1GSC076_0632 [Leptospira sp. Fiocruz LV4135]
MSQNLAIFTLLRVFIRNPFVLGQVRNLLFFVSEFNHYETFPKR